MIREVEKKYCTDNLIQLLVGCVDSHLIISADEIIFLKIGDKVLIDKYMKNQFNDNMSFNNSRYNEFYEYGKLYLNFKGTSGNFYLHKHYFFDDDGKTLNFMEELSTNKNLINKQVSIFDRSEIEELFNSDNYDSMYILRKDGTVLFANSKNNGCIVNRKIIPSDNDIIDIVLDKEKNNIRSHNIFCRINGLLVNDYVEPKPKEIGEIKNLEIYGSGIWLLSDYSDILIISKDGKFEVKWFNLYFIEENKFKLTTSDILVSVPTIQDIIDYSSENVIKYVSEPLCFSDNIDVIDEDKNPLDLSIKVKRLSKN